MIIRSLQEYFENIPYLKTHLKFKNTGALVPQSSQSLISTKLTLNKNNSSNYKAYGCWVQIKACDPNFDYRQKTLQTIFKKGKNDHKKFARVL